MKIMVTGFDPFGGAAMNPSWEAVQLLPDRMGEIDIIKRQIPTEFQAASRLIREQIAQIRPDVLFCMGLYGGSTSIHVERLAINLQDARIPDNAGFQPQDRPIRADGPAAYFTTLPTRKIMVALNTAGIPAMLSYSAGAYVCNTLLYSALDEITRQNLQIPCGFFHVPYSPQMAASLGGNAPSMELPTVVRALTIAMACL